MAFLFAPTEGISDVGEEAGFMGSGPTSLSIIPSEIRTRAGGCKVLSHDCQQKIVTPIHRRSCLTRQSGSHEDRFLDSGSKMAGAEALKISRTLRPCFSKSFCSYDCRLFRKAICPVS